MTTAPDIGVLSIVFAFVLVLIPIFLSIGYKLGLLKEILISVVRMSFQLILVGFLLTVLFEKDNFILTSLWLLVMVIFAVCSITRKTKVKLINFFFPVFVSLTLSTLFVLLYFNRLIIKIDNIYEAKYIIALGGMILGNTLKGNIVGMNDFFSTLKRDEQRYLYRLSCGASVSEAVEPFFKKAVISCVNPILANVATMGVVFLPGMMVGQIIGGSDPIVAIKYQIAIMIAIFVSSAIGIVLALRLSILSRFDEYGVRKE